jgi:hypothetical protein
MVELTAVPALTPDMEADAFLHHVSDEFAQCRSQGHSWPKLKPGKVPKGIRLDPLNRRAGVYQVTFVCPVCKMERMTTTLPKGVFDKDTVYVYKQPAGYAAPKGSGLTPRDFMQEVFRRTFEDLLAQAPATPAPKAPAKPKVPVS